MTNLSRTKTVAVCFVCMAVLTQQTNSQERRISRNSVPKAIRSAFENAYPKARVKTYSIDKENGKTFYEIESYLGKMSLDVSYKSDGTVAEVEEGVVPKDLPSTVKQTVKTKYPQGRIDKAERKSVGGTLSYEISVLLGKKKVDIEIDSRGKIVDSLKPVIEDEETEGEN